MIEKWKIINFIDGYNNIYEVSNFGNIRRIDNKKTKKPFLVRGYSAIKLCNGGKYKNFYVHRLVAQAFIKNMFNKPEVDHIDTDKTNNNVNNLRWVTRKENMNNSITLSNTIIKNKTLKQNDKGYRKDILDLRKCGLSYKEIAQKIGCAKSTVSYHLSKTK
jgi:Response regulator containing a CheY-like receiver domain and an HTH DNA-binding domain